LDHLPDFNALTVLQTQLGSFTGIGVGPGPTGYLTVKSQQALLDADLVLVPKAQGGKTSTALTCIKDLELPEAKIVHLEYPMTNETATLDARYEEVANQIVDYLQKNLKIAYVTLGDPFLYSTYIYTVQALKKQIASADIKTLPGISSFQALASALNMPLGTGKEKILILPCPDAPHELALHIEQNENVVLMKIGDRFPWVYELLKQMDILPYCALGKRIGLDNEILTQELEELDMNSKPGYLSVMLIRKSEVLTRQDV